MTNASISASAMRQARSLITKKYTTIQVEVRPKNQNDYFIHLYRVTGVSAKAKTIRFQQEEEIDLEGFFELCCACYLVNMKQARLAHQKSKSSTKPEYNPVAWVAERDQTCSTIGPTINLNGFESSAGVPDAFLSDLEAMIADHDGFFDEKQPEVIFPISHVFCSIPMQGKTSEYLDTKIPVPSPLMPFFEQYTEAERSGSEREKKSLILSYTNKFRKTLGENFNSHANTAIWVCITLLEDWALSEKFYIETLQNDTYFSRQIARGFELISDHDRRYMCHLYLEDLAKTLPVFSDSSVYVPAMVATFPANYMRNYLLSFLNRHTPDYDMQHKPAFYSLPLDQCGFGFADGDHQNRHAYALVDPKNKDNILTQMHRILVEGKDKVHTVEFVSFLGDIYKRGKRWLGDYQSQYDYLQAVSRHFNISETLPYDHCSMALLALTGDHDAKRSATKFLSDINPDDAGQHIHSVKLIRLWMEFYNRSPFEAMQLPSITEEDKRWLVEKLN